MFILSALAKRGPFHTAKVITIIIMCNTFKKIMRGKLRACVIIQLLEL